MTLNQPTELIRWDIGARSAIAEDGTMAIVAITFDLTEEIEDACWRHEVDPSPALVAALAERLLS